MKEGSRDQPKEATPGQAGGEEDAQQTISFQQGESGGQTEPDDSGGIKDEKRHVAATLLTSTMMDKEQASDTRVTARSSLLEVKSGIAGRTSNQTKKEESSVASLKTSEMAVVLTNRMESSQTSEERGVEAKSFQEEKERNAGGRSSQMQSDGSSFTSLKTQDSSERLNSHSDNGTNSILDEKRSIAAGGRQRFSVPSKKEPDHGPLSHSKQGFGRGITMGDLEAGSKASSQPSAITPQSHPGAVPDDSERQGSIRRVVERSTIHYHTTISCWRSSRQFGATWVDSKGGTGHPGEV